MNAPPTESGESAYIIRNFQLEDFDQYVLLRAEAERLEPGGRSISPHAISEGLNRPRYSAEKDLFLVETKSAIVGYIDLVPEMTIGRVIVDCWIQPKYRGRGLEERLLGDAEQYTKKLEAAVMQACVFEGNTAARAMFSGLGFSLVRCFLELGLDLAGDDWTDSGDTSTICIPRWPGAEEKLTEIQNRCFTGTWGYNPNTLEDIVYNTSLSHFTPEDIIFTCDGDRVIGYCWAEVTGGEELKGRICMLGTDPDYRDKGIGKRVLLAGLSCLKKRGLRYAELTVDSENKPACALYKALGFEVWNNSLWYEKPFG